MNTPIGSNYPVVSVTDSGIYRNGKGYERIAMFTHWDLDNDRRLARVFVRVDRRPSESFANVDVWCGDEQGGWQTLISWSPLRFWTDMPGWDRAGSPETRRLMNRLVEQLTAELVILADTSDI